MATNIAGDDSLALELDITEWTTSIEADVPFELDQCVSWELDNVLGHFPDPSDSGCENYSTSVFTSSPNDCDGVRIDFQSSTLNLTLLPDITDFLLSDSATSNSMFEGPYLTFRYTVQQYTAVSRMSTISRRQSPFVPTARSITAVMGTNFILQNIKAYPFLLDNQSDLSPFVHHTSIASDTNENSIRPISDHLAVCKNIVHMYQTRTPQMKAFVWRSIEAERQRFANAVSLTIPVNH